jgi:3-hexulose-6-phosphate synthase
MQLQVAFDRLTLDDAIHIARQVQPHADWIEVGTSLIKEFGMASVRQLRQAVQKAQLLADMKTIDNARYEFDLCFAAGADAATVMGAAPDATIATCVQLAQEQGKQVMIDLLNTSEQRQQALLTYDGAIAGIHVSKDVQESGQAAGQNKSAIAARLPDWAANRPVSIAGGIRLNDIPALAAQAPDAILIVGSAITQADDPAETARAFATAIASQQFIKGKV